MKLTRSELTRIESWLLSGLGEELRLWFLGVKTSGDRKDRESWMKARRRFLEGFA